MGTSWHDNAPAHVGCSTKTFLQANAINVMEWPAMLIVSPTEYVSDALVCRMRSKIPSPVFVARIDISNFVTFT